MANPSPNYAEMFKKMSSDRPSKSVKELLGSSNQHMNIWGEVASSMQKEVEDEARKWASGTTKREFGWHQMVCLCCWTRGVRWRRLYGPSSMKWLLNRLAFDELFTGPGLDVSPDSRSLLDDCIATIICFSPLYFSSFVPRAWSNNCRSSDSNSVRPELCHLPSPIQPKSHARACQTQRGEAWAGKMTGQKDRRVGTRHDGLTVSLYCCLLSELYGSHTEIEWARTRKDWVDFFVTHRQWRIQVLRNERFQLFWSVPTVSGQQKSTPAEKRFKPTSSSIFFTVESIGKA